MGKSKFREKLFTRKWEAKDIFIILFGILVNLGGRFLASKLNLPFWLDSIGTCYVAILFGIVPGALIGFISNMIYGIGSLVALPYSLVSVAIAIAIGFYYSDEYKYNFETIMCAAISAILSVVISTPLNILFYGGYTGNLWGDGLFDMLAQNNTNLILNAILSEGFVDIPDKVLSLFISSFLTIVTKKIMWRETDEK